MSEDEMKPPRFSSRLPLPLLLFWGFLPALLMTLSGLLMEWRLERSSAELLLLAGAFGGPVVLFFWSLRVLWPADMKTVVKVLIAIPLTFGACVANLFLAAGACSLFEPPFS